MKTPILLLALAALALVGGAYLIGIWMVGVAIMLDAVGLAAFALWWDFHPAQQPPSRHDIPTVAQILERAKGA